MFENIGGKIKGLAKIICWIGIIISVLFGIRLMGQAGVVGIFYMAIGALLSWVGSFVLYGFGDLVESANIICNLLVSKGEQVEHQKTKLADTWKCKNCGAENNFSSSQCKGCGQYKE